MGRVVARSAEVQAQALLAHRRQRRRVLPPVCAHHLVVDAVAQQRRPGRALEHVVEPLVTQLADVDARDRIDGVAVHVVAERHSAALPGDVVVRADQQVVLGPRPLPVMLAQVMQGADLAAVEIAGRRQHRNVDRGELVAVGDHALPVAVVGGMVEPAPVDRIGRAVEPVAVAEGAAFDVPLAVHAIPARVVLQRRLVEGLVVGDVERPVVREAEKDAAFFRIVDAGRHGDRGHQRLERLWPLPGRGPLGEAFVAAAEHADTAVAPRLRGDPVDHRGRVAAVVFEGHRRIGAAALAARQRGDRGIAVGRAAPGFREQRARIGIDGEIEQGRQFRRGRAARAQDGGADLRAVRAGDEDIALDQIAPRIVFGQQRCRAGGKVAIDLCHQVRAQQRQRIAFDDARLALLRRQGLVQCALLAGRIELVAGEATRGQRGCAVVQGRERGAETGGEGKVEIHLLARLRFLGQGVDLVLGRIRALLWRPAQRRQRAQCFDGAACLGVAAGDELQSEQSRQIARTVFVAVAGDDALGQYRHGPLQRVALFGRSGGKFVVGLGGLARGQHQRQTERDDDRGDGLKHPCSQWPRNGGFPMDQAADRRTDLETKGCGVQASSR